MKVSAIVPLVTVAILSGVILLGCSSDKSPAPSYSVGQKIAVSSDSVMSYDLLGEPAPVLYGSTLEVVVPPYSGVADSLRLLNDHLLVRALKVTGDTLQRQMKAEDYRSEWLKYRPQLRKQNLQQVFERTK